MADAATENKWKEKQYDNITSLFQVIRECSFDHRRRSMSFRGPINTFVQQCIGSYKF